MPKLEPKHSFVPQHRGTKSKQELTSLKARVLGWAEGFVFTTFMASLLPLTIQLFPALAQTNRRTFLLSVAFYGVFTHSLIKYCRGMRSRYGYLHGDAPRSRLSKEDFIRLWVLVPIPLFLRQLSIFVAASDKGEEPWLAGSNGMEHWIPGWDYAGKVLLWTAVMDYAFYAAHRLMHENRWLYKHIHSKHHEIVRPTAASFLHDSVTEKIFNSFIQVVLASMVVRMSFWELHFTIYAVHYSELLGHSGVKALRGPPYLPVLDLLDVGIRIEDHDMHHRITRSNFGKQTLLWDKLFGTYLKGEETYADEH